MIVRNLFPAIALFCLAGCSNGPLQDNEVAAGEASRPIAIQVANAEVSGGVLSGDTYTNDPMLSGYGLFSIPGDDIAYIIVRMKKTIWATTGAEYFWANEDGSYHPDRRAEFATINDGQFHTYFSSPSSSANAASWIGKTIIGLRFD